MVSLFPGRTFSPLLPPLSSAPFHCCFWDAAMSSPAAQYDDNLPVKVVIIGDSGVGKTAITQRFVDDTFSETTAASVGGKLISNAQFIGIMIILLEVETFWGKKLKILEKPRFSCYYFILWGC